MCMERSSEFWYPSMPRETFSIPRVVGMDEPGCNNVLGICTYCSDVREDNSVCSSGRVTTQNMFLVAYECSEGFDACIAQPVDLCFGTSETPCHHTGRDLLGT